MVQSRISLNDDKSKPSFYPKKSKPENYYLLSTLGQPFLLTKSQSLVAPETQYKILTILKLQRGGGVEIWVQGNLLWGWKYGYRETSFLFLTTSLNFLFSLTMGRSFELVVFPNIFSIFVIGNLISLFLKHHYLLFTKLSYFFFYFLF